MPVFTIYKVFKVVLREAGENEALQAVALMQKGSIMDLTTRIALNVSPDLNLSLFVQYDNESAMVGSYSRLRWTFAPLGDLYIVYKHNVQPELGDRWQQDQNQLIIKLTYGIAL